MAKKSKIGTKMNIALWVVQVLLAALFVFAGVMKLITPVEVMLAQMTVPLPGWFLQFIGVAEVLGGLGLVLPGLVKLNIPIYSDFRTKLTPLAAAGLAIIMLGAVIMGIFTTPLVMVLFPLIPGLLCAFVLWGRWER